MRVLILLVFLTTAPAHAQSQGPECAQEFDLKNQIFSLSRSVLGSIGQLNCSLGQSTKFLALHAGLSPLWAQEQVGADLAKQFMIDYEKRGGTLQTAKIADIDEGFRGEQLANLSGPVPPTLDFEKNFATHATQVMNLLGGKSAAGVGYKNLILPLSYNRGLQPNLTEVAKSDVNIVNLERHALNEAEAGASYLLPIAKEKIVVAAAGNFYESDGHIHTKFEQLKDVIVVGSTNESGLVSEFSETSPDVTILAPSDLYLTAPAGGSRTGFGQTSGAAPIVSGALSNAVNFLPDLTPAEARTLVTKTATYLPSLQVTRDNGAGLINAFKLARVAERLKTQGWPNHRADLLANSQTYDFKAEAADEFARAKLALKNPTSCGILQNAATHLRKSFLLDANSENSALLSFLLLSSTSPRDAQLYAFRSKAALEREEVQQRFESARLVKDPPPDTTLRDDDISPALRRYHEEKLPIDPPAHAPRIRAENSFALDQFSSELIRSTRTCYTHQNGAEKPENACGIYDR